MHVNLPLPKENRKFTAFLNMQIWQKLSILGELEIPIRLRFPFVQVSRFAKVSCFALLHVLDHVTVHHARVVGRHVPLLAG